MDHNDGLRKTALLTPVLLLVMLIGSLVFYKQSMLFSDCSHNIFRIINNDHLQVEASRYGIAISQLFPLTAARLHLPLSVVMMSYAASFYVFYFIVSLLLVYKYRNYGFAILLGLYVTLLVSDSYYYLNNEGIACLLLVFALNFFIAEKRRPTWVIYLVFIPTVYFALWTHPLVMMAAIYLWFFFMPDKSWPYTKANTIILTVILIALSGWKFYEGMRHGYDSVKIESLTTFDPKKIFHVYDAPQFRYLLKSCVTNYWCFTLIFIAGLLALLRERKYWLALLTLGFAGGYFVLLCITYWDTESRRFYMEIEYMPLSIITSAAFVYYVLPRLSGKAGVAILVFVYLVRLVYMRHAIAPFSDRLALIERMNARMKEKNITKLLITEPTDEANKTLIMNWGSPVESILLSRLDGEMPQRTFMFMDKGEMIGFDTSMRDVMAGCWAAWTPTTLNHVYFNIDTLVLYKTMTYAELMR